MGSIALRVVAVGLLALGSGCVTADAPKKSESKKPDVTQPGVLPPPQEVMRQSSSGDGIVQAGGTQPGATTGSTAAVVAPAASPSALAKFAAKTERKIPATDMAVVWRNRIEYLPDPSRNGGMGAGIAGQLFLYGGPNMQFALADGPLTVDLIDDTPRPPGQPAAKAERWQFDKNTLRNLRTSDETFGKCYLLFLPWPGYRPDITRVKISARYDPDNGHTIFLSPSVLSIDTSLGAPVWERTKTTTTGGTQGNQLMGGMSNAPGGGMMPPAGGGMPFAMPQGSVPAPGGPMPFTPGAPSFAMPQPPVGAAPATGSYEPLAPIAITIGQK